MRKNIAIISINFGYPFHSLILTLVNNFDSTHGCPLRHQNGILDNPIPCKFTLSVYSIWSMKWYDPNMFHNTNLSTPTM